MEFDWLIKDTQTQRFFQSFSFKNQGTTLSEIPNDKCEVSYMFISLSFQIFIIIIHHDAVEISLKKMKKRSTPITMP